MAVRKPVSERLHLRSTKPLTVFTLWKGCRFASVFYFFLNIFSHCGKNERFGKRVWFLQYSVKLTQTNSGFESFACSWIIWSVGINFALRINVPRHKYAVFNLHSVSLARIKRAAYNRRLLPTPFNMMKRHAALIFQIIQQVATGKFTWRLNMCAAFITHQKGFLVQPTLAKWACFLACWYWSIFVFFLLFLLEGGQGHSVLHQICSVTSLSLSLH